MTVIGATGVKVGNITTSAGGNPGGEITLVVGNTNLNGLAIGSNGTPNGAQILPNLTGPQTSGDLSAGALFSGAKNINLLGASSVTDHLTVASVDNTGNSLFLRTGLGITNLASTNIGTLISVGNGGGSVKLVNSGALLVDFALPTTWDLDVTASSLTFNSNAFNSLKATTTSNLGMTFLNAFSTPTIATNADLTLTGGGNVVGILNVGGTLSINTNGNIGASAASRFITNASALSLTATNAFINRTGTSPLNLNQANVGTELDLVSAGTILTPTDKGITSSIVKLTTTGGADIGSQADFLKFGGGIAPTSLFISSGTGNSFLQYIGTTGVDLFGSDGNDFTLKQGSGTVFQTNGADSTFAGNINITFKRCRHHQCFDLPPVVPSIFKVMKVLA